MKSNRSILVLTAIFVLLGCPVLVAQDKPAADGIDTTIPEVTGTFTLYPSHRPDDAAKLEAWLASGEVLKTGWKGKVGKNQYLAFIGASSGPLGPKPQDADLAKLKDVTALQSLDLYSCYGITDAGLAHLKGLTSLQWLYLNGCNKVTDAGRAALKKSLPRVKVSG